MEGSFHYTDVRDWPRYCRTMAICSYVVLTEAGSAAALAERLGALPGCDMVPADRHDLLLLVTESGGPEEDAALRERLQAMEGVAGLFLTFGDLRPGPLPPSARKR